MRKKEFMFDNCKLCQYGGATKSIFGDYYDYLTKFFNTTSANGIIREIERTVKKTDLQTILTEYEPKVKTLRSGKKENLEGYSVVDRFGRFNKLDDKVIKAILQGYKNNPSNEDFNNKLQANPDLSVLYNNPEIVTVLSSEEEIEMKEKLEGAIPFPEQQAEAAKEEESNEITAEGLLHELNVIKNGLCDKYGGVTSKPSNTEMCINPMSNKFIDGIESKRKEAADIAKLIVFDLNPEEFREIISNSEDKSIFNVDKFIKIYDKKTQIESRIEKINKLGGWTSRNVVGNLVGEYTGKIYLDTLFAVKFLMNFFLYKWVGGFFCSYHW